MAKDILREARRRAAAKQFDDAKQRTAVASQDGTPRFRCDACGETFASEWPEEQARGEAEQVFGDTTAMPQAVLCDPCFQAMKRAGVFPS